MGYKDFFQVLESESSSIVSEDRFILTETAFNIRSNRAYFNCTMSGGDKSKFTFAVESPLITATTVFSSSYPCFSHIYSVSGGNKMQT